MFRELYIVVESFYVCTRPLIWTVIFMLILLFLFAMFAVELIGKSDAFNSEDRDRFSRAVSCIVVLFQLMTLDEWYAIISPLLSAQPWKSTTMQETALLKR